MAPDTRDARRRRLFGSLLAVVFLLGLSRVAFAPLVGSLMEAFDVGEGTIGFVLTLVWGGTAVSAVPVGYALTLVSRRSTIVACGLAPGGANVLLADLYPAQVGQAVGTRGMSQQVASTLAPVAVTAALAVGPWRTVFATVGVAVLVATVLYAVLSRDVEPSGGSGPQTATFTSRISPPSRASPRRARTCCCRSVSLPGSRPSGPAVASPTGSVASCCCSRLSRCSPGWSGCSRWSTDSGRWP
jgi:MFS family permease